MGGDELQRLAIPAIDHAGMGIAEPNGTRQYAGKYRLEIAGRTADKPEHRRGRALLLGDVIKLAGEPLIASFSAANRCGTAAHRRPQVAAFARRRRQRAAFSCRCSASTRLDRFTVRVGASLHRSLPTGGKLPHQLNISMAETRGVCANRLSAQGQRRQAASAGNAGRRSLLIGAVDNSVVAGECPTAKRGSASGGRGTKRGIRSFSRAAPPEHAACRSMPPRCPAGPPSATRHNHWDCRPFPAPLRGRPRP